ncbi:hypothetical protein HF275_38415, partial [Rhizobium leguminosarum]|nr:hypothetical protein [Rhizobium leguminosarum]
QRFVDALTDIRTWENKSGIIHANWALHIPAWLQDEFLEKLPVWIAKVLGSLVDGCYSVQPVFNLNGLMRYMLKGTQKANRFGIRHVPQGEIWGRRAVAATCLGRAARERDKTSGLLSRTSTKFRKASTPEAENPAEEAGL